jgi:post-segregation antitoxin (ccd killing protein)
VRWFILHAVPAKNVERITVSLPRELASELRDRAAASHRGNVSAATAHAIERSRKRSKERRR